jgi:gas vesicle protein
MTQPPYVPPRSGDDPSTASDTWPPAEKSSVFEEKPVVEEKDADLFASQFPDSTAPETGYSEPTYSEPAYSDAGYVETTNVAPVSEAHLSDDYSTGEARSTKDVAKDQAGVVKDTAVEQGQQVAGVAKEQAAAVKDTAVDQGQQVAGVAKEQAAAVKDTAIEQGQQVAGVAKDQATRVASEASGQVKDLLAEGLSEVRSQAGSQQKRLASGIHSLAGELGAMASKSDQSGPLTDFAHQASAKGGEVAHWLENAEPSEVLDSLRSFARRRPAAFLGLSALAGVVVGRLTRGFVANAKDDSRAAALTTSVTPQRASGEYSTAPYSVDPTPARANISLEEIPTSGSGYGGSTDAPDYVDDDATLPYGTSGRDGVAR